MKAAIGLPGVQRHCRSFLAEAAAELHGLECMVPIKLWMLVLQFPGRCVLNRRG